MMITKRRFQEEQSHISAHSFGQKYCMMPAFDFDFDFRALKPQEHWQEQEF
jgi:RNase adaptor protein for sRNA GlmZ degradation